MPVVTETVLDYDRSVSIEQRFAVRRFIDDFVSEVNTGKLKQFTKKLAEPLVVEGFEDYALFKNNYVAMLEQKFSSDQRNFLRFPVLKLTLKKSIYYLAGTYEEFTDNILSAEGTIEIKLAKQDESFQFFKIKFFPRMKLQ